jgi:hypothetical protein
VVFWGIFIRNVIAANKEVLLASNINYEDDNVVHYFADYLLQIIVL